MGPLSFVGFRGNLHRDLAFVLDSPYLRPYFRWIKRARGSARAIIATTRKFFGIIYKSLTNNWIFNSFPSFVITNLPIKIN